jgi:cholesterol oxidase
MARATERAGAAGRADSPVSMVAPISEQEFMRFDPRLAREKRPLQVGQPETFPVRTDDGVELRLTRYRGGAKGPVILSHCIGVSSLMYSIDTIEPNLLEYLFHAGYDVWLLDHRFSINLPVSREQFSFDDIAMRDYPAVVSAVCQATGVGSVQIVAHGVGSSTLTMALLSGLESVRAAVLSQVSTHLYTTWSNRLKAQTRMPALLSSIGVREMTAYTDAMAGSAERLYDGALRMYPVEAEERCSNPVCRRITVMYGQLYEHDRLNDKTHDALPEMFGVVNLRAFAQLSRIVRAGHLVDEGGAERYLPHLDRLKLPIAFIHGSENVCVLPRSTEHTANLLSQVNGADYYRHHLIDGYGHVDCIFGHNAARDVYGHVLEHLDSNSA